MIRAGRNVTIDPLISSLGVIFKALGSAGCTVLVTNQKPSHVPGSGACVVRVRREGRVCVGRGRDGVCGVGRVCRRGREGDLWGWCVPVCVCVCVC
jgi:hypothetical protein